MQRERLAVLIVLTSLVAMALVGVAVVSPIGAEPPDDAADRTISVEATGGADAPPDRAVVRVAAVAEGDDPAAVRDDLADNADALRENLEATGVTEDDYETTEYRIREARRPPEERPEQPRYRGVHAFEVTLDDPERTGAIVDAAADANAEIGGIEFTLSEAARDELREEAIERAMSDARTQADVIARSGELHVTSVRHVDATQQRYRPVSYELDAVEESADAPGTAIDTGDVSVEYRVRVTYNATTD